MERKICQISARVFLTKTVYYVLANSSFNIFDSWSWNLVMLKCTFSVAISKNHIFKKLLKLWKHCFTSNIDIGGLSKPKCHPGTVTVEQTFLKDYFRLYCLPKYHTIPTVGVYYFCWCYKTLGTYFVFLSVTTEKQVGQNIYDFPNSCDRLGIDENIF